MTKSSQRQRSEGEDEVQGVAMGRNKLDGVFLA